MMNIFETLKNIGNKPDGERRMIVLFAVFFSVMFVSGVWFFNFNFTTANTEISYVDQTASILPTTPFGVVEVNLSRIFDAFKNFISR